MSQRSILVPLSTNKPKISQISTTGLVNPVSNLNKSYKVNVYQPNSPLPVSNNLDSSRLDLPTIDLTPNQKSPIQNQSFESLNETLKTLSSPKPLEKEKFSYEEEFEDKPIVNSLINNTSKITDNTSTLEFENYQGVMEKDDIEKSLLEKGYVPIDKILTKKGDTIICEYIKAIDKVGHVVYIQLDCDGHVNIKPNEMVMAEQISASVVPYSVKIGTYEAANNDLYGVGFECDNEICMINRKDESLAPSETVFSLTSGAQYDHGILQNHPIPYPIVKYSEIMSEPSIIADSIKNNHARMRNVSFGQCMKEVDKMKKQAQELIKEIEKFDEIHKYVSNTLSNTICQLENIHDMYENYPPKTEVESQKLRRVRFNLRKRHDLTNDHITLCNSIAARGDKLKNLKEELREINDYAKSLFNGIENVLSE